MAAPTATVTLADEDITHDLYRWHVAWGISVQGAGSGPAVADADGTLVVTAAAGRTSPAAVTISIAGTLVWSGSGQRRDTVEERGVTRETWQLRSAAGETLQRDVAMAIDEDTLADACAEIASSTGINLTAVGPVANMPVGAIAWQGPLIGLLEALGRLAGGFAAQTSTGAWRIARWSDSPTFSPPATIGTDAQPFDRHLVHRPEGWLRDSAQIVSSSWAAAADVTGLAALTLTLRPRESRLVTIDPPGDRLEAKLTSARVERPATGVTISAVTPLTSGSITMQVRNGLSGQSVAVQIVADGTARDPSPGGTLTISNDSATGGALTLPAWHGEPLDTAALWVSPALRNRGLPPELRTTTWRSPTTAAIGADVLRRVTIARTGSSRHSGMVVGRAVTGGMNSPPRLTVTTIDVRGGTLAVAETSVAVSTTTAEITVRSELASGTVHYRWRRKSAASWTTGTISITDGYGRVLLTSLSPSTNYVAEVAATSTFTDAHELAWQTGLNTAIRLDEWDGIEWRLTPSDGTAQRTGTIAAGTASPRIPGGTNVSTAAALRGSPIAFTGVFPSGFVFGGTNRVAYTPYRVEWLEPFVVEVPKAGTVEARPVPSDPRAAFDWQELKQATVTGSNNVVPNRVLIGNGGVSLGDPGTVWPAVVPDGSAVTHTDANAPLPHASQRRYLAALAYHVA